MGDFFHNCQHSCCQVGVRLRIYIGTVHLLESSTGIHTEDREECTMLKSIAAALPALAPVPDRHSSERQLPG